MCIYMSFAVHSGATALVQCYSTQADFISLVVSCITETGDGESDLVALSAARLGTAACCVACAEGCLSSRSFVRAAGASPPGRAEEGTCRRAAYGDSSTRLPRTPSSPLPAACPRMSAEEGGAGGRCLGRGRR